MIQKEQAIRLTVKLGHMKRIDNFSQLHYIYVYK
jgi:hypothetical protein